MRKTLRRSCDACAKSKLSCDLRTPKCSRCLKRRSACAYANQPLTSSSAESIAVFSTETSRGSGNAMVKLSEASTPLFKNPAIGSVDPFDSYPRTRLPRAHVQRLIHHFLSNIAFQYYPLDLNRSSNPFVVSWWPLALADPALFHVSLQTASLDEELRAQNGFPNSEILMADSVSLVRHRIEDPTLASEDETMDSVVTLAAIEHGKGNFEVSKMHIDGVKSMVAMRGGIHQVKLTSPLTARMVAWVSMIVTQSPQFQTQNDFGIGDGIPPVPQWQEAAQDMPDPPLPHLAHLDLDPTVSDIIFRLRHMFDKGRPSKISNTVLHDLTCFVLHRLLLLPSRQTPSHTSHLPRISECLRHALALYMLVIHGPTYYSHAILQYNLTAKLKASLEYMVVSIARVPTPIAIWLLSVGMVASIGTPDLQWFAAQARLLATNFQMLAWADVLTFLRDFLWLEMPHVEIPFRQRWEEVLAVSHQDVSTIS